MAGFLLASRAATDWRAAGRRSMHELALSQSIVELVLERAAAERLRTVTRVVVEVGAAAGVDPEALRFCFEAVTEETAASGAKLVLMKVPRRVRCRTCRPAVLADNSQGVREYARRFMGRASPMGEFDDGDGIQRTLQPRTLAF